MKFSTIELKGHPIGIWFSSSPTSFPGQAGNLRGQTNRIIEVSEVSESIVCRDTTNHLFVGTQRIICL
jgi:hypothetical protein